MTTRQSELLYSLVLHKIYEAKKLLKSLTAESPFIPEYQQELKDLEELLLFIATTKTTD